MYGFTKKCIREVNRQYRNIQHEFAPKYLLKSDLYSIFTTERDIEGVKQRIKKHLSVYSECPSIKIYLFIMENYLDNKIEVYNLFKK